MGKPRAVFKERVALQGIESMIATALILTIRLGIPIALLFAMGYSAERSGEKGTSQERAKTSTSPFIWPAPPIPAKNRGQLG